MGKGPVTVIIAGGGANVRAALRACVISDRIPQEFQIEIVAETQETGDLAALTRTHHPHIILMDGGLHSQLAPEALNAFAQIGAPGIVVGTGITDEEAPLRRLIDSGVCGALPVNIAAQDFAAALYDVKAGRLAFRSGAVNDKLNRATGKKPSRDTLTEREREILREIASGKSNNAIASDLGLTKGTVKGHVSTILSKLGVADRAQATRYAVRRNLV